jgi:hypothetical protein
VCLSVIADAPAALAVPREIMNEATGEVLEVVQDDDDESAARG